MKLYKEFIINDSGAITLGHTSLVASAKEPIGSLLTNDTDTDEAAGMENPGSRFGDGPRGRWDGYLSLLLLLLSLFYSPPLLVVRWHGALGAGSMGFH